jgi:O-antigen/teichoic acid export membrane protein
MINGTTWSVLGNGCARGLSALGTFVAARALGKESFGAFSVVQLTIATTAMLVGLQVGTTATRYIAEYRSAAPARALAVIRLSNIIATASGAVAAVCLFVSASWVSSSVLGRPEMVSLIRLAAPGVFCTLFSGVQLGVLAGLEDFKSYAYVNGIGNCCILAFILVGTLTHGVAGAVGGWVLGNICLCVCGFSALRDVRQRLGLTMRPVPSLFSERHILFSYSFPTFIASFVLGPVLLRCNALMMKTHSLAEVGLYSAADRFRLLLLFVPTALMATLFPVLSNLRGTSDHRGYKAAVRVSSAMNLLVLALPATAVAIGSKSILTMAFGRSFAAAGPTLAVLCAAAVSESANMMLGNVLLTSGKVWLRAIIDLGLALLLLVLATFWIPEYGALGFAWAYTVAFFTASLVLSFIVFGLRHELWAQAAPAAAVMMQGAD